jgi:dUTP pyrophosphatase
MSLYLWIPDENLRADMRNHLANRRATDSGVDLLCPAMTLDFSNSRIAAEIRTGVVAAARTVYGAPAPCLLMARSSTSLTPLRMSNQIGLVDMGYRGELIARVDCENPNLRSYEIEHGRRLFQIVQHDWMPFLRIHIVDSPDQLPPAPDSRGAGGFGSTGLTS